MDSSTAARLIELNRDFYNRFGDSFSATRHRIQPGVRRVLTMLHGDEAILDLGCGNGELAGELVKRGHRGSYLGVDFSLPMLREARSLPDEFSAKFLEADLTSHSLIDVVAVGASGAAPRNDMFDIVFCFAALHHIPSSELRLRILRIVRELIKEDGLFIHSNWQFLNSDKLKARIQPWEEAAAIPSSAVDAGDYLLDWRNAGKGLRYVHQFDEKELEALASASSFRTVATFHSDGEGGRLGLYQIWRPVL